MAMIRCKRCGNLVSDYAAKCERCGNPINRLHTCPRCGMAVSGSNANCPNCGYRLGASIRQVSYEPSVIDHGVRKSTNHDNRKNYLIAGSIVLAAMLVAGIALFLSLRDSDSYFYGGGGSGGGSVPSSSGRGTEPLVVRPSNYDRDNGYKSTGDPERQFQQELVKERVRKIEQEAKKAEARAERARQEEENNRLKQQVWQEEQEKAAQAVDEAAHEATEAADEAAKEESTRPDYPYLNPAPR